MNKIKDKITFFTTVALVIGIWALVYQTYRPAYGTVFGRKARNELSSTNTHSGWLALRQKNIFLVEQGSQALQAARMRLAVQNLDIPRDAAICLDARRQIDADLVAAMQPGREFGEDLTRWHAQTQAIGLFCDYALSIGGAR